MLYLEWIKNRSWERQAVIDTMVVLTCYYCDNKASIMHKEWFVRIVLFVVVVHLHLTPSIDREMILEFRQRLLSRSILILLPVPVVLIEIRRRTLMSSAHPHLHLISNWSEELKKLWLFLLNWNWIEYFFFSRLNKKNPLLIILLSIYLWAWVTAVFLRCTAAV